MRGLERGDDLGQHTTLFVADCQRTSAPGRRAAPAGSRRWAVTFTDGDIVMCQAGPMIISLWDRSQPADDSGVAAAGPQWGGFTLGDAVGDAREVDQVRDRAVAAGATLTSPPREKGFGYSGVFADPDGHTW